MRAYPAYLEPQPEGGYLVTFPDLPGCLTQGETPEESLAMAQDALGGHLACHSDVCQEIPEPSSMESVNAKRPPAAILVLVQALAPDSPPARINITLGKGLLAKIDQAAKQEGMTRSGFLASAARKYLAEL